MLPASCSADDEEAANTATSGWIRKTIGMIAIATMIEVLRR